MCRRIVLSLLLAAGAALAAVPAAEAHPVCTRATLVGGDLVPTDVETGQTCAGYPYGVYCQWHYFYSGNTNLTVDYCVPGVI